MEKEIQDTVESILNYIKGEIFRSMSDENAIIYSEWIKTLMYDSIQQEKELALQNQIKNEQNKSTSDVKIINSLKKKKKKYAHSNYNHNLKIGDIVYVNYGYGYCGELSTGHYGIIMSEIVNNMYYVVTLSSDPLKLYEFYFEGLNLPNYEANVNKKSYVRFEQSRFMHYRRLTNITINDHVIYRSLSNEQIAILKEKFADFMKID